jgi:hypothetical protein
MGVARSCMKPPETARPPRSQDLLKQRLMLTEKSAWYRCGLSAVCAYVSLWMPLRARGAVDHHRQARCAAQNEYTALMVASAEGHTDTVAELARLGAGINVSDKVFSSVPSASGIHAPRPCARAAGRVCCHRRPLSTEACGALPLAKLLTPNLFTHARVCPARRVAGRP